MSVCPVLVLTGCNPDDVRVYRIPKEKPATATAAASRPNAARPERAIPTMRWETPAGWTEQTPSGMSVATLQVTGRSDEQAEASAVPFPGVVGRDLDIVNILRGKYQLEPLRNGDATNSFEKISVGAAGTGRLFEMVTPDANGGSKSHGRILVATFERDGTSWFFKFAGDDALVRDEKARFLELLRSVSFSDISAPPVASTASGKTPGREAGSPLPEWTIPATWQEQPPSQMLLAKFVVPGDAEARAEMTVSSFPGDVGGLLPNINRWRKQVGLDPLNEEQVQGNSEPLKLSSGAATLVDVTGKDPKTDRPSRLIGIIQPHHNGTWFYKLMGNEAVVAKEKVAFLKFLQTIRYPDA